MWVLTSTVKRRYWVKNTCRIRYNKVQASFMYGISFLGIGKSSKRRLRRINRGLTCSGARTVGAFCAGNSKPTWPAADLGVYQYVQCINMCTCVLSCVTSDTHTYTTLMHCMSIHLYYSDALHVCMRRESVNPDGSWNYTHTVDEDWDVNEYLAQMRIDGKSALEIYWRIWGLVMYSTHKHIYLVSGVL